MLPSPQLLQGSHCWLQQQVLTDRDEVDKTGFLLDPPLSDEARALGVVSWR